ncbi:MAG TPA: T9SS type A sorting domain-containing protein, partial [Saprospiraceae bacterium]|nr:T9SS type A sorting domain-containing protein [Saprospiraceae bacterium]
TEDLLKAWPNPTSDFLNIHLNGGKEFERIVLYNLMGQEVYNSGSMKARNAQIGTSQLANGIYVLSVVTPEGRLNKKIEVIKE